MTEPKLLFFDIETSPILAYTFSLFKPVIGMNQIKENPRVICWSAKWNDKGKNVQFMSEYHDGYVEMLIGMRDLLNEADIVVGYNSDRFDITWLRGEFAVNNIEAPSPYRTIDLFKVNKQNFRFPSGKLDYLALRILDDRKVAHEGFGLWMECIDPEDSPKKAAAWKRMKKYARKDTALLQPLFEALLPYIKGLNFGLYSGEEFVCTHCGSDDLQKRGYMYTNASRFQRYYCNVCGGWSSDSKRIDTTQLRPIAAG